MKKFIALCATIILSACINTTPPASPQKLSFTQYPPIKFNVARIDVIDEYKSPLKAPNIEHLMPYSPAESMHIWIRDRLRAVGSGKWLQVTIKDAGVVATDLPKTQGLQGFFTVDQDKRYDAKLVVEMRIYDGSALSKADVSASATQNFTIAENATVEQRRAAYMRMISDLMNNVNLELEKNISNYMNTYIDYSPN